METLLPFEIWTNVQLPIVLLCLLLSTLRWILWGDTHSPTNPKIENIRRRCYIFRLSLLKRYCGYLPRSSFISRKDFYLRSGDGFLNNPTPKLGILASIEELDNAASAQYVKYKISYHLMQFLLGYALSYIFQGRLAAAIPFPLPYKFKEILQMGINTPYLNARYISALPWYLIVIMCVEEITELFKYFFRKSTVLDLIETRLDYRNSIGADLENDCVCLENLIDIVFGSESRVFEHEKVELAKIMASLLLDISNSSLPNINTVELRFNIVLCRIYGPRSVIR